MSKFFLDHKTLYYDVSPFLFYVLYELDEEGNHPAGYFSKEKDSDEEYNLACILVLPPYQRKGYGNFLIKLSYELSKREGKVGSPEKPLSDLGAVSYRSFWLHELLIYLHELLAKKSSCENIPIEQIEKDLALRREDVIEVLHPLDLVKVNTSRNTATILLNKSVIEKHLKKLKKQNLRFDPDFLEWPPK